MDAYFVAEKEPLVFFCLLRSKDEPVVVTDFTTGVTTEYLSARSAALALNASNSTVMNKLKGKNTKPYKGRYLIKKLDS